MSGAYGGEHVAAVKCASVEFGVADVQRVSQVPRAVLSVLCHVHHRIHRRFRRDQIEHVFAARAKRAVRLHHKRQKTSILNHRQRMVLAGFERFAGEAAASGVEEAEGEQGACAMLTSIMVTPD